MAYSESSSTSFGVNPSSVYPLCHCSKATVMTISWSDDNPGRRFFKCEEHGFVCWHDKEQPCMWQKQSLLEAREKILTQTQEIKALGAALRKSNAQLAAMEVSRSSVSIYETLQSIEVRVTAHINASERMVRKLVVFSGGGLALATAAIVYFLKK